MITVLTYYKQLSGIPNNEVLRVWQESWQRLGYQTVVLSESDADLHPSFQRFSDLVSHIPSINAHDYEYACWIRWLAFAQWFRCVDPYSGRGNTKALVKAFISDYDVVPTGRPIEPKTPAWLHPACTPLSYFSRFEVEAFVNDILNYHNLGFTNVEGQLHCSDMTLAIALRKRDPSRFRYRRMQVSRDYPKTDYPFIHVPSHSVPVGKTKAEVMRSIPEFSAKQSTISITK